MGAAQQFKYAEKITASDFSRVLAQRIDDHFRRRSRHADAEMVAKTVLGFALFFATYAWLISDRLGGWPLVGV